MTTPTDDELLALPRKLIAYVTQRGEPLPDDEDILAVAHGYIALHERRRAEVERLTREKNKAEHDVQSVIRSANALASQLEHQRDAAEAALAAERKRCGELARRWLTTPGNHRTAEWWAKWEADCAALAGKDAQVTNDQKSCQPAGDSRSAADGEQMTQHQRPEKSTE